MAIFKRKEKIVVEEPKINLPEGDVAKAYFLQMKNDLQVIMKNYESEIPYSLSGVVIPELLEKFNSFGESPSENICLDYYPTLVKLENKLAPSVQEIWRKSINKELLNLNPFNAKFFVKPTGIPSHPIESVSHSPVALGNYVFSPSNAPKGTKIFSRLRDNAIAGMIYGFSGTAFIGACVGDVDVKILPQDDGSGRFATPIGENNYLTTSGVVSKIATPISIIEAQVQNEKDGKVPPITIITDESKLLPFSSIIMTEGKGTTISIEDYNALNLGHYSVLNYNINDGKFDFLSRRADISTPVEQPIDSYMEFIEH